MIELDMTLVAQLLNFAIAAFIITKFGYKPLRKMIDERQAIVRNQLDSAEKANQEAEAMRQEYQETLQNARKDAQAIIERAKLTAEAQTAEILEKTREESARIIRQAQEAMANEKERIMQDVRSEVTDLSVLVAGKIIGESMNDERQMKLVDEYIDQLGNLPC